LHDRLAARNAFFRDVSGWESPSWYAPISPSPPPGGGGGGGGGGGIGAIGGDYPPAESFARRQSFGREDWFGHWSDEHRACREGVALFDVSFMSKFAVMGRDAGELLNRLSTANVDGEVGVITYTQWLNESVSGSARSSSPSVPALADDR
jgi:glycine cleavage system aminomethyltransferase T